MHVTKDGKKLGTGNNFPNTKSSYSISSDLIFHYLLHYQLDSSMRDQKVFCVFSALGILSNNKNTAFGMQLNVFSLLEMGSILISDQVAQVFIQLGLENAQGHRFHGLCGLPVANYSLQIIVKHFLCIFSRNRPHLNFLLCTSVRIVAESFV